MRQPNHDQLLYLMTKLQNLKAIHNLLRCLIAPWLLYLITKLQNLKAIHNLFMEAGTGKTVVSNYKITKSESYSQPCAPSHTAWSALYLITKLQNLKAIHNKEVFVQRERVLYLITKLQNLKAIHNIECINSNSSIE